ncbi:P-loop containing nucleoside triphosphate hydrolase protein [Kickxella alabastrina]|uniref:P-loop containing nucleoside triphosphate hydrolase protein n=1 Tax=Kickxella alabastrina TaxID=61397 RepID=UPI00222049B4|nr:P-loop containing nucleoside triphosphate hydrolase protein [Kickxella alabastrina]KAI7830119.1 P-loop containing nucleoside triphosphate hydrolase protein [Kickxella alabastrina]
MSGYRKSSSKKEKTAGATTAQQRMSRRDQDAKELESLGQRVLEMVKPGNTVPEHKLFSEMPISWQTLRGLERANYVEMTEIQRKALPYALARRDVLGAAKTGSGKTLAFLLPILENLNRARWTSMDGLGALVISPTRELAMQIFDVLCKIGKFHKFSAGLVIGGKRMNILVCTPGRLLQHMDETVGFDCDNLQVLVLDEADRILDMGFKKSMNAIIANLPKQRQTLLFSATQTKSVKDLARLSLERPEYVGVHESDRFATPSRLSQYYMVVDLPQKLDMLFSFMKTHINTKTIVFMSSGKQVRFIYETFCRMQPGTPLLHLHGKQKQMKRVEIFERFMRMNKAVMFCTDIAARGLDFPAVDWVVQLDCPEDCDTYLHRVGRTARYDAAGKGLMFLLPSEAPEMARQMAEKNIPIKEISAKSNKVMTVAKQLQNFCFQDSEIKYLGQRAFVTYVRSVFLQKNKRVFDVEALPLEEYAEALGLPGAPNIKFVKKTKKSYEDEKSLLPEDRDQMPGADAAEAESDKAKTRVEKMFARKNAGVLADHYQKLVDHSAGGGNDGQASDNDDDFITLKRADHTISDSDSDAEAEEEQQQEEEEASVVKTIAINPDTGLPVVIPNIPADQMSKRQLRKNTRNTKIVFDDEGNARPMYELKDEESFRKEGAVSKLVDDFQQRNKIIMAEADIDDLEAGDREEAVAVLGTGSDSESDDGVMRYESDGSDDDDDDDDDEEVEVKRAGKRGYERQHSEEDEASDSDRKKQNRGRVLEVDNSTMSLEDQERLALQLLGGN